MRKMIEPNCENAIRQGEVSLPPLDIRLIEMGQPNTWDALIDVAWAKKTCRFVVECKRDARPQTLRMAANQAQSYAKDSDAGRPMVIVPYLTAEKIDELLAQGVSGIDLCGNGGVEVPGLFSVYRTGQPNLYRQSTPLRSAYRGDSSLVARALLLKFRFGAVGDILDLIETRGGSLVMSTVSKALKRLESDLVIERPNPRKIRLIDPDRLLDQLLKNYQPPKQRASWLGRIELNDPSLRQRISNLCEQVDVVRTGMNSAADYVTFAGENILECYTRKPIAELLDAIGGQANETQSFPNLRLIETDDQRVFFDARENLVAAPLQTWLEMASGDKRSRESAEPLRQKLLRDAEG